MNEDEHIKWRDIIGDFMLKFSEVEAELNILIYDFIPSNEIQDRLNKQFKERANDSLILIDGLNINNKLKKRLKRSINELIKLADNTRNLIAHNPLNLSLESLFERQEYLEIRSYRNTDKTVTYSDLKSRYEELCLWTENLKNDLFHTRRLLLPEEA